MAGMSKDLKRLMNDLLEAGIAQVSNPDEPDEAKKRYRLTRKGELWLDACERHIFLWTRTGHERAGRIATIPCSMPKSIPTILFNWRRKPRIFLWTQTRRKNRYGPGRIGIEAFRSPPLAGVSVAAMVNAIPNTWANLHNATRSALCSPASILFTDFHDNPTASPSSAWVR